MSVQSNSKSSMQIILLHTILFGAAVVTLIPFIYLVCGSIRTLGQGGEAVLFLPQPFI